MVYPALFTAVIALHQLVVLKARKGKIDWLSDLTFVDATFFILFVVGMFLVFPEVGERMEPPFALLILSGMVATYAGLHARAPKVLRRFSQVKSPPNVKVLWWLSAIYFGLIALYYFGALRSSDIGLSAFLSTGRMREYLTTDYLSGSRWLLYLSQSFQAPVLILFMYLLIRKKRKLTLTLFFLLAFIPIIAQDRLGVFMVPMLFVFYYHRVKRPIRAYQIVFFLMVALIVSGTFDLLRSQGIEGIFVKFGDLNYIIQRSRSDLNPVLSFEKIYTLHRNGYLDYDYFYQYLLSIVSQVPKVLWTNKPITAFEPRYTEIVYDVKVGTGVAIATFTSLGEGIAMLGYLGVVINCFVFGYIYSLSRNIVGVNLYTTLVWYSLCMLFFPFFRGSTSALISYLIRMLVPLLLLWPLIFPIKVGNPRKVVLRRTKKLV